MDTDTTHPLVNVARYQKRILRTFLFLWLLGIPGEVLLSVFKQTGFSGVISVVVTGFFIIVYLYLVYSVYKLSEVLQYGYPLLWVVGMITPVALIVLFFLNRKAVQELREKDVHVGFLGASVSRVQQHLMDAEHQAARVE